MHQTFDEAKLVVLVDAVVQVSSKNFHLARLFLDYLVRARAFDDAGRRLSRCTHRSRALGVLDLGKRSAAPHRMRAQRTSTSSFERLRNTRAVRQIFASHRLGRRTRHRAAIRARRTRQNLPGRRERRAIAPHRPHQPPFQRCHFVARKSAFLVQLHLLRSRSAQKYITECTRAREIRAAPVAAPSRCET